MKIVKVLIWLGFAALLAVSIPKVAWVFRSYEGIEPYFVTVQGFTIDILWLIPLFVSFCIDALILAATYAVSIDKTRASQVGMWLFVALLALISCYCNLLYNLAHKPSGSIWDTAFISIVTPFILSCVPLFALCYTLILSRLDGKGESLEEKAIRLEREKGTKQRIKDAQKGRFIHAITDGAKEVIQAGKEIGKEFQSEGQKETYIDTPTSEKLDLEVVQNSPEFLSKESEEIEEEMHVEDEDTCTEEIEPEIIPNSETQLGMIEQAMYDAFTQYPEEAESLIRLSQELSFDAFVSYLWMQYPTYKSYITPQRVANVMRYIELQSEVQKEVPEQTKSEVSSGKLVMSWDEAVRYTGYAESTLKRQLTSGQIKLNKKGDKLLISSLRIRTGYTAQMPVVKGPEKVGATNGHHR